MAYTCEKQMDIRKTQATGKRRKAEEELQNMKEEKQGIVPRVK